MISKNDELRSKAFEHSPVRCELLNWFREKAPPLADAYQGAVRLVDDSDFPGRIHFISHAVRDITDRLAFVIDPQLPARRVQYANELDLIERMWPQFISVTEPSTKATSAEKLAIDYKVASLIESLVAAHRESRRRPSNSELLFRALMRNEPTRVQVNQRLVADFKKLSKWFMALTHLRADAAPTVDEPELQLQFKKFETTLHCFVGNFFTGTNQLDEILQQANQ